jgi:hypothetical protein
MLDATDLSKHSHTVERPTLIFYLAGMYFNSELPLALQVFFLLSPILSPDVFYFLQSGTKPQYTGEPHVGFLKDGITLGRIQRTGLLN